jgi:hypothetical protein
MDRGNYLTKNLQGLYGPNRAGFPTIQLKMYSVRVSVGVSANLNEVFVISISSSQMNTERVPFNIILLTSPSQILSDIP